MQKETIKQIKEIAEPIVAQQDMFLVDVEVKHQKTPEIWILVDSELGDINLDSCSKISRRVGEKMEEEDIFSGSYRLNVSSPGLSRPLSDKRQYPKNRGREIKVKYRKEDDYHTVTGVLKDVDPEKLVLVREKEDEMEILFDDLVESKIIPKI